VLPFFEAPEGPVSRMLTDRGTEYWGSPAREDELDLAVENLEHTRTTGKSPPTKGIVERLPKMLLTEFSRMTFRKKIDPSLVELQTDSEEWGRSSNEERVHQGRWGFGRTPKQPCIVTLPVAKATL
jgi:hypothetical protein